MEIVLYASVSEEVLEQARKALTPSAGPASVKVHRSIRGLSQSVQPPRNEVSVVVLLVAKREDILELICVRHLFRNVPVVLVVPDTDNQTIALAHRLRPRYLTYIDGNFLGLSAVVNKMSERYVQS